MTPWIIALSTALAAVSSLGQEQADVLDRDLEDAVRAECAVAIEDEYRRILAVHLKCPIDAENADALQAAADEVVGRLALPITLEASSSAVEILPRLGFILQDGVWDLEGPVRFVRYHPDYPGNETGMGIAAVCVWAGEIPASGRAEQVEIACRAFTRDDRRRGGFAFRQRAQIAIARTHFLVPNDESRRCFVAEFRFMLGGFTDAQYEVPPNNEPTCESSQG